VKETQTTKCCTQDCGKRATIYGGHVHKTDEPVLDSITAGWCEKHVKGPTKSTGERCGPGCYGRWLDWMGVEDVDA